MDDVDGVDLWTGRRAAALRAALRMSNEAFANRLGAAVRTVANWEAKPDIVLSPAMQEVLDAALAASDDSVQRWFGMVMAAGDSTRTRSGPTVPAVSNGLAPNASVDVSQAAWRETRQYLTESGIGLAQRTADLYDDRLRVSRVPALALAGWVPEQPVPLEQVKLHWARDAPPARFTGAEAEARATLPLRAPGSAFQRYSSAIRYLRPPALFENRQSYRLLDVRWDGAAGQLGFGVSTFFDKLDVGEALSHEAARAELDGQLGWEKLPFRLLLADPFDLSTRAVNPGISTLTVRLNTVDRTGTFFLLRRDPVQVTNGRHLSLLPAGEFQPASTSTESVESDLDIWRNLVREYSEEMLGRPEHDGSSGQPVDYEVWPFYRDLTAARTGGQVRVYVLGIVLDALSLNASIAAVAVIEDATFDQLFRDLVHTNPEGEVLRSLGRTKSVRGLPFDETTVSRLITSEPLGQTSAACLSLAWSHRRVLLDRAD